MKKTLIYALETKQQIISAEINPFCRTHTHVGGGIEKKMLMQNEWQVNGEKFWGLIKNQARS